MTKITINEKWIDAEKATFIETKNPSNDKRELYLETQIVPFNKISRNGIKYNEQRIIKTHEMLVGRHLMHNHVIEGADTLARGEWIETRIAADGMYAKARVYDTDYNKDYIEYLQEASSPRVSLQVTGDAEQKKNKEGKYYQEAFINDWLEASTVNVPGFDSAKGSFAVAMAEAFNGSEENKPEVTQGHKLFEQLNQSRNKVRMERCEEKIASLMEAKSWNSLNSAEKKFLLDVFGIQSEIQYLKYLKN